MLTIHTKLVEAMLAQARKDYPIRTCGVIAGPAGSNLPIRLIPMQNTANSQALFNFEPDELLQVWKQMEMRGEEPIVIYYSYTDGPAYPNRTDAQFALEPQSHYFIISTDPLYDEDTRSFRIIEGSIIEERIQLMTSYMSEHELSTVM